MGALTVSAMEGLVEVEFSSAEVQDFLDDMIGALFMPRRDHEFTKDQSQTIGTYFKAALDAGITASSTNGLTYDATLVNAHVQTAIDQAYALNFF